MHESDEPKTRSQGNGSCDPPFLKLHDPDEDSGKNGGDNGPAEALGEPLSVWFKLLHEFTDSKIPCYGSLAKDGDFVDRHQYVTATVREAHDLAVVAAFRAMERMCAMLAPPDECSLPPIVFTVAGKDQ